MSESKRGGAQLARAVEKAYQAGQDDYHLEPMVLVENGKPVGKIGDGDAAVFCCRRGEREIELTELFTDPDFNKVQRNQLKDLDFVIMTMYHDKFKDLPIAFAPSHVVKPLAQVLSEAGKNQFHCAESEKYAHVTFFFNGGVEAPCKNEDRALIASPKVATYDLKPEMSAYEVAEKAAERIRSGKYDLMILNFANPDMVGHTGVLEAAVKAVEAVDACVGTVVDAIREVGGEVIITADHGNAELMIDPKTGSPFTAHTTNIVPCILVSERYKTAKLREGGILADLAPTLLDLMGLEQPKEMTGKSLLCK